MARPSPVDEAEARMRSVLPPLIGYAMGEAQGAASGGATDHGVRPAETHTALKLLRLAATQTELLLEAGGALGWNVLAPRLLPKLAADPDHAELVPPLASAFAATVPGVAARGAAALLAVVRGARDALDDAAALADYFACAPEPAPTRGWVPADVTVCLIPGATKAGAGAALVTVRCAAGARQLGAIAACVYAACVVQAAPLVLGTGGESACASLLALARAEAAHALVERDELALARIASYGALTLVLTQSRPLPGVAMDTLALALADAAHAAQAPPPLLRAAASAVRAALACLSRIGHGRLAVALARLAAPLGRALVACAAASHAAPADSLRLLAALAAAHALACVHASDAIASAAPALVHGAADAASTATPNCREALAEVVGAAATVVATLTAMRPGAGRRVESSATPSRKRQRRDGDGRASHVPTHVAVAELRVSDVDHAEKALLTVAKEASAPPSATAAPAEVLDRLNRLVLVVRSLAPLRCRNVHAAARDAASAWLTVSASWISNAASPIHNPGVQESVVALIAEAARWRSPGGPGCRSRGAEAIDLFPPGWSAIEQVLRIPLCQRNADASATMTASKLLAIEAAAGFACFANSSEASPWELIKAALGDEDSAVHAAGLAVLPHAMSDRRLVASEALKAAERGGAAALVSMAHASLGMIRSESFECSPYPPGFARAAVVLSASRSLGRASSVLRCDGRLYEPTLWALAGVDGDDGAVAAAVADTSAHAHVPDLVARLPMPEALLAASGELRDEVPALLQRIHAVVFAEEDPELRAAALRLLRRSLCAALAIREDYAPAHADIVREPLPIQPPDWHVKVLSSAFSSRSGVLACTALGFATTLVESDVLSASDSTAEYNVLKCIEHVLDSAPALGTSQVAVGSSQAAPHSSRAIIDTALCTLGVLSHRVRTPKMPNALILLLRRLDEPLRASRRCLAGCLLRRVASRVHPGGGGTRQLLIQTPVLLEFIARSVLRYKSLSVECADVLLGGSDQKELLSIALPVSLPKILEMEREGFDPRAVVNELSRCLGRDPKDCLLQYGPMALARCYANSTRVGGDHATAITVARVEEISGTSLVQFLKDSVQELVHGIIWFGCADPSEDLSHSALRVKAMLSDMASEVDLGSPAALLGAHFVSLSTFLHHVLIGDGVHGDGNGLVAAGREPSAADPTEADGIRAVRCLDLISRLAEDRVADFAPQLIANLTRATNTPRLRYLALVAWHTFVRMLGRCSKMALARHAPQVSVALAPALEDGTEQECDIAARVLDEIATFAEDPLVANAIKRWPTLPGRDQLHEFQDAMDKLRGDMSAGDRMRMLLDNVQHTNTSVRYTALTELVHHLKQHGCKLPMDGARGDGASDFPTAGKVMATLLLCCSEGEVRTPLSERLQMRLAEALGELGAVDPARCEVKLRVSERLPKNGRELRLNVVKDHLSRLYGTASDLDVLNAATLAVQEILRETAVEEDVLKTDETELWRGLDEKQRSLLQPCLHSGLLLVEDVAATVPTLTMVDGANATVPTIWEAYAGEASLSFRRWLHLWHRRLVASLPVETTRISDHARAVAGVLKASSGAMRYDVTLMLHLLPIACHAAVCYGGAAGAASVRCEVLAVLASAAKLRSGGYSGARTACVELATQAVFQMLDTITQWQDPSAKEVCERMADEDQRMRQGKGESSSSKRLRAERKRVGEEFIEKVPLYQLAEAAVAVRAFARAIRYLHSHLRYLHRAGLGGILNPASLLPDSLSAASGVSGTQGAGNRAVASAPAQPPARIGFDTDASGALNLLREAHAGLADADSLLCLPSLRGFDTFEDAVVIAEAEGRWSDALSLREQALQHASMSRTAKTSETADARERELRHGQLSALLHMGHLHSVLVHADAALATRGARAQESVACAAYGVGAAWRLGQWSELEKYLNAVEGSSESPAEVAASVEALGVEAVANVCVGTLLRELRHGSPERLSAAALAARQRLMASLPAAAMESYGRAYPTLVSLQCIREVEEACQAYYGRSAPRCVGASDGTGSAIEINPGAVRALADGAGWSARVIRCRSTLDAREPVLAARRQALAICGSAEDAGRLAGMWLSLAELARHEGHFDAAASAVAEANSLKAPAAPLEHAKLLYSRGNVHDAMHELRSACGLGSGALVLPPPQPPSSAPRVRGSAHGGTSPAMNEASAKAYLRLARWAHRTGQESKETVVSFYEAACKNLAEREKAQFHFAEYHSELLEHARKVRSDRRDAVATSKSKASTERERSKKMIDDAHFYPLVVTCLRHYVRSLLHGHKHILRSLPRMLTLWFELGDEVVEARKANEYQTGSALAQSWNEALCIARSWVAGSASSSSSAGAADGALPSYAWLLALSQLTGRMCHKNHDVRGVVRKVLATTLAHYPPQVIWRLAAAERSESEERVREAHEVRQAAERMSVSGLAGLLRAFPKWMDVLHRLAYFQSGAKGRSLKEMSIQRHLPQLAQVFPVACAIPSEDQLTATLPADGRVNCKHDPYAPGAVTVTSIEDRVEVMKSLMKPKKVDFVGSDGKRYTFLIKPCDDLRKDARMIELNHALNALLGKADRKGGLRVKTFAVVPLGEEWGIVEWVHNTRPLRFILEDEYRAARLWVDAEAQTIRKIKNYYETYPGYAEKKVRDPANLFRGLLMMFPPVMHRWFLSSYVEPGAWYLRKATFTRSTSVWSMVGHVVGLGDRHGENILVDTNTGECMHIDFSCLFDKGLTLEVPEMMPFRLTQNLIDGFGVEGVDGLYRKACCATLGVLRAERNTLESVLEAFLHDPLFEWVKQDHGSSSAAQQTARDHLVRIRERLGGIVVTARERLARGGHAHSLPMSVEGQVRRLIAEATDHTVLGRAYLWWLPAW